MKVAVVTGIARTSGIGHAVCASLLECGQYAVVGFDKLPLEASSPLPSAYPRRFRSHACRVDADPRSVHRALRRSLDELGEEFVSVVVNNAGMPSAYMPWSDADLLGGGKVDEEEELRKIEARLGQFDEYIQNNLRSAFLMVEVCKPFFPPPTPREGGAPSSKSSCSIPTTSIINISSTRALMSEHGPSASQEGYASAKAGMVGLTHSLGQSLAGRARVNVILPGWIDTEDRGREGAYVPSEEDHAWHAAGRVGKPEDIAAMVSFLADDGRSGFITCQEFVVDGGVTKRMFYPE